MAALAIIPLWLALVCAGGWGICAAAGIDPQPRAMLAAGIVMLIASALGGAMLFRARGKSQADVAQSALLGLTLHLFGALAMSGAVYLFGVRLDTPFALWLLGFYFVTLAQLAAAFVRVLRAAPADAVRT